MNKIKFILFLSLIYSIYIRVEAQTSPYYFLDSIKINNAACFDAIELSSCQNACWEMSFIGLYKEMLPIWDKYEDYSNYKLSEKDSLDFLKYTPILAIDYILKQAKKEKVIMINEAHHNPFHRVFITSLLEGLYEEGYRYLGCEGISRKDSLLMERKIPVQEKTGYYVNEPQFGNLIRVALDLGFTVFGYDGKGEGKDYQSREIAQVNHIKAVLDKDSTAKILIHAGWGHILEDTSRIKLMAYHFQRITGINPYTVNQTTMSEHSEPQLEDPIYRMGVNQIDTSSVFLKISEDSIYRNKKTDIIVFHPRTTYINNRPNWLYARKGYIHKKISLTGVDSFPIIIKVALEEEPDNAVPIDVLYVDVPKDRVTIFVPEKEKYKIMMIDKTNKLIQYP